MQTDQSDQMEQSKGGRKVLLSQQIANTLKVDVANGKFKDGRLPTQGDLCARFSVSGSVIREALNSLKAQEIIHTVNGVGTFVAERSVDPLKHFLLHYASGAQEAHEYSELMELRLALETTCAEKIAEHNMPEALKHLHLSLGNMETSLDDMQAFSDADLAFHSVFVEFSGNSIMKAIYSSLTPTIRRFMDVTLTDRQDAERNLKEHRGIYKAICSGNVERASQFLRDHLLYARRRYRFLVPRPANARHEDSTQSGVNQSDAETIGVSPKKHKRGLFTKTVVESGAKRVLSRI